ncbi:MAG: hypothetical protein GX579_02400 [Chloroflexi bacterium]|nr:hypothetical protein [Chloroflexota bacterium]
MDDTIELDRKKYRRTQGQWYDEHGISVPATLSRRLDQEWRRQSSAPGPQAVTHRPQTAPKKPARRQSRDSLYKPVYPFIAEIIRQTVPKKQAWINHREIVAALSRRPEARSLIAEIAGIQGKSAAWTADNIVRWFSAHYTQGQSAYQDDFERQRVDGVWAYRPRMSNA